MLERRTGETPIEHKARIQRVKRIRQTPDEHEIKIHNEEIGTDTQLSEHQPDVHHIEEDE